LGDTKIKLLLLLDAKGCRLMETDAVFEPGAEKIKVPGAVLIEGLPGVGLVAKAAVAYLLVKLGGRRICRFYSPFFPSVGYVRDGKVLPYFADFYLVESPRPLILLYGNAQPSTYYGQHEFCQRVIEVAADLGVSSVITLGGYGKDQVSDPRVIYLSSTSEESVRRALEKIDAVPYEGQIVGAAGLLILMAGGLGMENMSLLIEAGDMIPDYLATRRGVEVLVKLLDLDLEIGDIYDFSMAYEEAVKTLES
jgi:proteasome assembly chaperone (PAC2) family protein